MECVYATQCQLQSLRTMINVRMCLMTSVHQAVRDADACTLLSQLHCSKHGSTLLVLGISWARLCVVRSRTYLSWNWLRWVLFLQRPLCTLTKFVHACKTKFFICCTDHHIFITSPTTTHFMEMAQYCVNETSALSCIQNLGVVHAITFPEYQRCAIWFMQG